MSLIEQLRALSRALPADGAVTLSASWLKAEMASESEEASATDAAAAAPHAPLTVLEVANRYHRSASTVRGWLERGCVPGAYRIDGTGAWRIPESAIAAFERDSVSRTNNAPIPPVTLNAHEAIGDWRSSAQRRRRSRA